MSKSEINVFSNRGLTEQDFVRVANNGFGDPHNAYPHSMEWFNDYLFVGTTRGNLAHAGKQREIKNDVESLEIWPVPIPENAFDIDLRAEIWRYAPQSDEWVKVFASPWVIGADGFEVPMSIGFRTMAIYQGTSDSAPVIYTPTWGSHQTPYTLLLRCADSERFEVVSQKGMGFSDPKPRALRGFINFKGKLFMSPGMGQARREANIAGHMLVMVTDDPANDKWEDACIPHFGNTNNQTAFQLAVFNDHLYAGTLNVNEGFEIWKTKAEGTPPYKWSPVLRKGAYRGRLNQVAMTFREFNGYLYVGTAIQGGGYDAVHKVGPAAPEILRIAPDDSWDLVVGEPRNTPDGLKIPLSDLGPGYNNLFAGYHWAMEVHEGWLYSGNAVWTLFTKYLKDGTHLPESVRETLRYLDRESMSNRYGGCQLWRTRDGHRWYPVTLNGFGNYCNMGIRTMKSTPYGLFVGTTNPFGPDIAVKRLSGWKYEHNPDGGLEIWLGARKESTDKNSDKQPINVQAAVFHREKATEVKADTDESPSDLFSAIYHPSMFRHLGFWNEEIKTPSQACENLVDELVSLTTTSCKQWVDIACGYGATTQYLARSRPDDSVIGLYENKDMVPSFRELSSNIQFKYSKPSSLKMKPASTDCAFWVKADRRLGSRRRILAEAYRILKPGGELVFFDFLVSSADRQDGVNELWSCENSFPSLEGCRHWMQEAGFRDIDLYDVTYNTLEGIKRYLEIYLRTCLLVEDFSKEEVEMFREQVHIASVKIDKCIVCYAVKPL